MSTNPYESPALDASELAPSGAPPNRQGPVQMALIGPFVGAGVGGAAGALTSGVLGFLVGMLEGQPIDLLIIGALLGLFVGAVGGTPLGLIIGLLVGSFRRNYRLVMIRFSAVAATLIGGLGGLLGGSVLAELSGLPGLLLLTLGGAVGCGGGTGGGILLGRMMGHIAWGPEQSQQQSKTA